MNVERSKWLEALWETSVDGVFVVDADGVIIAANPAACRMFGHEVGGLDGNSIETLLPPDLRSVHEAHRHRYRENPKSRVMRGTRELLGVTKHGVEVPVEISLTPVKVGLPVTIAVVRDVSDRHEYEAKLRHLSFHDALTGLHNRAFFDEELQRLEVGRLRPVGVIMADIDGLKFVNDHQGHVVGDELIRMTAEILKSSLRVEDLVARFGGDEFAMLLPSVGDEMMEAVIQRIRANVASGGASRGLRVSVGGAVATAGDLLKDVLRRADANMYADKRSR